MGYADLHIHSTYSFDGSATVEAILEQAARRAHLDVIAVTDHDSILGGIKAARLAPHYGIQAIPGVEISTAQGHLIALFVHHPVPPQLGLMETVELVRRQGGICIVPHPMALAVHSVSAAALHTALGNSLTRETLVGVETINAGLLYRGSNQAADALCRDVNLASVGSSDSHLAWTVGHGLTEFPGRTIWDLRSALVRGETRAMQPARRGVQFYLSSMFRRLLRMLGWVTWMPCPYGSPRLRPLAEIQD